MTIQDLLVKDGKWPTVNGPHGMVIKKNPAWITWRVPRPSEVYYNGGPADMYKTTTTKLPNNFTFQARIKPVTVPCEPNEKGVVT